MTPSLLGASVSDVIFADGDARYEGKRTVVYDAVIDNIQRNTAGQIVSMTATVQGQAGVPIQTSPNNTDLGVGGMICVENLGTVAAPSWMTRGSAMGGMLHAPAFIQAPDGDPVNAGTIPGMIEGDIRVGHSDGSKPNIFLKESDGSARWRLGTTDKVVIEPTTPSIVVGEVGAGKPNIFITDDSLQLRVNTTPAITLASDGTITAAGLTAEVANLDNAYVDGTMTVGTGDTRIDFTGSAGGGAVQSHNFSAGAAGWKVDAAGDAEFNNATIRGTLRATVSPSDVTSALSGTQVVAVGATMLAAALTIPASTAVDTDFTLEVKAQSGAEPFADAHIVKVVSGASATWFLLTAGGSVHGDHYDYAAHFKGGTDDVTYAVGAVVLDYGVSGGGVVSISSSGNTPLLSILTHEGAPWSSLTERARLGNLAGITGASGYGLWTNNGFFEGTVSGGGGNVLLDATGLHTTAHRVALSLEDDGAQIGSLRSFADNTSGTAKRYIQLARGTTNAAVGELLPNTSWESGGSLSSTGWTIATANGGFTVIDNGRAHIGTYSLFVDGVGDDITTITQTTAVTAEAGKQYRFTAWVYGEDYNTNDLICTIKFYSDAGATTELRTDSATVVPVHGMWSQGYLLTNPAPATTVKMRVVMYRFAPSTSRLRIRIDDMSLTEGSIFGMISLSDDGIAFDGGGGARAPFSVSSGIKVTDLNADALDGLHDTDFHKRSAGGIWLANAVPGSSPLTKTNVSETGNTNRIVYWTGSTPPELFAIRITATIDNAGQGNYFTIGNLSPTNVYQHWIVARPSVNNVSLDVFGVVPGSTWLDSGDGLNKYGIYYNCVCNNPSATMVVTVYWQAQCNR